jgi:DNA modification methylase
MIDRITEQPFCQTRVSGSTFVNADCFDVFPFIEDKSIDAIICDLPYGTTACKWDSILPLNELWKEYKRVIKPNGVIILFGTQPFTTTLISSNIKQFRYELIWDKIRSATGLNAKRMPLKTHENMLVFYTEQPTYNPQLTEGKPFDKTKYNGQLELPNVTGGGVKISKKNEGTRFPVSIHRYSQNWRRQEQIHPTQKPVELIEYLVKTYTNENDMVLDNTCGSGTLNLACLKLNRKSIGIEKEKQYYDVAVRRASEYCR